MADDREPEHGGVPETEQGEDRAGADEPDGQTTALPRRVESWRRRSATGAILSGIAFGLREVMEPERDEPSIMMETSGVPPKDLPVEADLEDALPRRNVVKVRPWLLEGAAAEPDQPVDGEDDADPSPGPTPTPARRRSNGRWRRR